MIYSGANSVTIALTRMRIVQIKLSCPPIGPKFLKNLYHQQVNPENGPM